MSGDSWGRFMASCRQRYARTKSALEQVQYQREQAHELLARLEERQEKLESELLAARNDAVEAEHRFKEERDRNRFFRRLMPLDSVARSWSHAELGRALRYKLSVEVAETLGIAHLSTPKRLDLARAELSRRATERRERWMKE